MTYNSLFGLAKQKDPSLFDFTHNQEKKQELHRYDGKLCDVIDSVQEHFQLIWQYDMELVYPEYILELLLMNARILRSILDYKDIEKDIDYIQLVQGFLDVSTHLYNLDSHTLEILSYFTDTLHDTILSQQVVQIDDSESWVAMDPYFSKRTAHKLQQELGREDYVFITLGHGGIVPGIDVFLRLQQSTEEKGDIYPLRFSRIKHKDKTPQLGNNAEAEYISNIIQGRTIVIFDEDSSSGNTLKQARSFFESDFSGYNRILQVSNLGKGDYETDSFII